MLPIVCDGDSASLDTESIFCFDDGLLKRVPSTPFVACQFEGEHEYVVCEQETLRALVDAFSGLDSPTELVATSDDIGSVPEDTPWREDSGWMERQTSGDFVNLAILPFLGLSLLLVALFLMWILDKRPVRCLRRWRKSGQGIEAGDSFGSRRDCSLHCRRG